MGLLSRSKRDYYYDFSQVRWGTPKASPAPSRQNTPPGAERSQASAGSSSSSAPVTRQSEQNAKYVALDVVTYARSYNVKLGKAFVDTVADSLRSRPAQEQFAVRRSLEARLASASSRELSDLAANPNTFAAFFGFQRR